MIPTLVRPAVTVLRPLKTVAVIQSSYIPWKGYFDIIKDADLFVFYDDVQYTKNDWRNRNLIKTEAGVAWLTVPVGKSEHRLICDVRIANSTWPVKHWKTLQMNYSRTPYFGLYRDFLEDAYLARRWNCLSELNQYLITAISRRFLGITCQFADSRDFALQGHKQERLIDLLQKTHATHYVSGPAAQSYIDPNAFSERSISLRWKSYSDYPTYNQLHPPFCHTVTILDLLFNVGQDAPWHIWGHRSRPSR
jgi:hypothetical protein